MKCLLQREGICQQTKEETRMRELVWVKVMALEKEWAKSWNRCRWAEEEEKMTCQETKRSEMQMKTMEC